MNPMFREECVCGRTPQLQSMFDGHKNATRFWMSCRCGKIAPKQTSQEKALDAWNEKLKREKS